MRFVLDTNVLVAALRSTKGASAEVLRRIRQGRGTMLLTTPLLFEYEDVCKRPEILKASGLQETEVDTVLDVLVVSATKVETNYLWRPQLRDPKDEMVLEAAVNGRAEVLVTFNTRDFGPIRDRFGIAVIGPRDLLEGLDR